MATVGGVSSSTSTNSFYNNKISGLVSGLDTETLIENMTAGTRSKIAKQKQKSQLLQWKMDAMRSISNLLVSFRNKYASFTSPSTNLLNSDFFSRNLISTIGENSKYIKATGASNSVDSLSILGVKNLASSASMNVASASDKLMESGDLDLSDGAKTDISAIAGTTIRVKYADKITSISFASSGEFNSMQDVADAINSQFDTNKINVEASVGDNGELIFKGDKGYEGSSFEILGDTGGVLNTLGIKAESKLNGPGTTITGNSYKSGEDATNDSRLKKEVDTWDAIGGKSMTFSYNGVTKQIKLATKEEIDDYKTKNGITDNLEAFEKLTQEKLDKAFGKDRIKVDTKSSGTDKGKLTFETTDKTSILKVTTADTGLLGKSGVLGINYGESNRINTNIALKDSGLFGAANLQPASVPKLDADGNPVKDKDGNPVNENVYKFSINGVDFEFKEDEKISNIISTINKSDAGVTMSYNETSDSFSIKASDSGASGQIDIKDAAGGGNLAEVMFGTQVKDANGNIVSYDRTVTDANGNPPTNANGDSVASSKFKAGEDATISVDFGDGAGAMEIKRSSNVFDIDGMSITVTGTFGYDASGNIDTTTEPVTFDAQVDSDKAVDAVKQW